ncbi:MAG: asparagine synthase (glutamine-hydrolyzing) [Bacteroidetes bacterium]|nr:asparagine synthase (glutamine-hydrolyzing) [Bacteroidota bacterium]
MCGIAGYFSKETTHHYEAYLNDAVKSLAKRGPDLQQTKTLSAQIGFAHARLSIIDTSTVASQPMSDASGRFTIIFNGEIFNYRELKEQFLREVKLNSTSDTEVLLHLFIQQREKCLQHLNGFFAFAVYDNEKKEIFLARDRSGIKPLHIYADEKMVVFASELKAILKFPIKKEIDYNTLALYLQLNYVPGNNSILKNIMRLMPAHYAVIDANGNLKTEKYYSVPYVGGQKIEDNDFNYESSKATLRKLIEESVQRRLVSDVPLGSFLSGGIDSSIVSYCAAKNVKQLNTFSIGFSDEPYFDETKYANLVAKKFETNHTVFSISNDEMFSHIFDILDYIDEPFADSSAIAVFILSKKTREKVTVSLSGDGGDELFGGYNKHQAELRARQNNFLNKVIETGLPLFKILPKSRHSKFGNLFRQLQRYSEGLQLSAAERYWRWCVFNSEDSALSLLQNKNAIDKNELDKRKQFVRDAVKEDGELNDIFFADTQMVLPNDMLTKVDLMSMANSLEVRVPLLDYTVVDFAFTLPVSFKLDKNSGKKILKDAFRNDLPPELFTRPKHGFEVPLLKWMKTGLRSLIEEELLSKKFVEEQNIFDAAAIESLKQKLFSNNPEDAHATVWGLLVFQYWYKKYFL